MLEENNVTFFCIYFAKRYPGSGKISKTTCLTAHCSTNLLKSVQTNKSPSSLEVMPFQSTVTSNNSK
jgi:hypothetical protein